MDEPSNLPSNLPKIRVVVRKRPINSKEKGRNDKDIVEVKDESTLTVKEIK
jgi:hypothetical protein